MSIKLKIYFYFSYPFEVQYKLNYIFLNYTSSNSQIKNKIN